MEARLRDGAIARLVEEHEGVTLYVDGTPQSHVSDDPERLLFEYVQHMAHVIDALGEPGAPLTAVHLGAGALTLPRYIEATRPGSRQQVIELEPALIELVRGRLPLPRGASLRIRQGDAREVAARLPHGLDGACELVVVDIFTGAQTPAHVTSMEFYRELTRLLAPGGVVLVNVADGQALRFARRQAATLERVFASVAMVATPGVMNGRDFGNLVMIAGMTDLPIGDLPRHLARGYPPARLTDGVAVTRFAAGALPVSDDTATPSPRPAQSVFGGDRGRERG